MRGLRTLSGGALPAAPPPVTVTPTVNELRGPDGRPLVADDGTLADDASCGGHYEGALTELPRATALPVDAYADDDVTVWVESLTGDVAHAWWRVRVVADDGVVRTLVESKDLGVPGNVHAAICWRGITRITGRSSTR